MFALTRVRNVAHEMKTFMIERYLPGMDCAALRAAIRRAAEEAAAMTEEGAAFPEANQNSGLSSQRDPGERLDGASRGDVLFPVLADQ